MRVLYFGAYYLTDFYNFYVFLRELVTIRCHIFQQTKHLCLLQNFFHAIVNCGMSTWLLNDYCIVLYCIALHCISIIIIIIIGAYPLLPAPQIQRMLLTLRAY